MRVEPILDELHSKGVRLWWDKNLDAGQEFAQEIERRVRDSAGVIVFISDRSTAWKSQNWVFHETRLAADLKKEVLPVRLDRSTLGLDWKTLVEHRQMIDAMTSGEAGTAVQTLVKRAETLGCKGPSNGSINPMHNFQRSSSIQHFIVTVLCVAVAVLLTILLRGPQRDGADPPAVLGPTAATGSPTTRMPAAPEPNVPQQSPPPPSTPDTPDDYLESIADETRTWTWSKSSALRNGLVTLHWEKCEGLQNMSPSNRQVQVGTASDVARRTRMAVRCCRFCYEIEFLRRIKTDDERGSGPAGQDKPAVQR